MTWMSAGYEPLGCQFYNNEKDLRICSAYKIMELITSNLHTIHCSDEGFGKKTRTEEGS